MAAFLLSLHVIAGILLIGPVTVAASLFPRHARRAAEGPEPAADLAVVAVLHRISRGYGAVGVVVPLLGLGTAVAMEVLGDTWISVSLVLTLVAGGLLAVVVLPGQAEVLDGLRSPRGATGSAVGVGVAARVRTLAMTSGIFATLWVVVVVLMIVRPGSSTGV